MGWTDGRTHGQTDGWTHDDSIYRASISSRGKYEPLGCCNVAMSEDRFNALVLLFVHKDIELDTNALQSSTCNARRHPRRMIPLNPLDQD